MNLDKEKNNNTDELSLNSNTPLNMHETTEESTDSPKPKKKKKKSRILKVLSWLIFTSFVLGCAFLYGLIKWASADLPSITKVADFRPALTTIVLARDGSLIGEIFNERRYLVSLDEIPAYIPQAFVSAEDKSFYEHKGINPIAILRAAIANFSSGTSSQGGSTITQQVVKRLLLTPERTYTRKLKEALLAFKLESQLSKTDIITIYINQIHMGGMSYGIEAGARYYFAKHAKDLTLAEAALLAGILPATTRYNPYRNPEMARTRQVYVLGRMREDGKITDSQYEQAYYEKLEFSSMPVKSEAVSGWYLEEVRRQLVDIFSEENSKALGLDYGIYGEQAVAELGLTVHTSMEPKLQEYADAALKKGLENASKRHGWRGAEEVIESTSFDDYLNKSTFELEDLENNNWVKALVVAVEKKGATVKFNSEYQGFLSVSTMGWARKRNKTASGDENSTYIKDATSVLNVGDVVFVRYNPPKPSTKENAEPPLLLADYTTEMLIPLALEQKPHIQGSIVSIEPDTSDVVAMVGGYHFGLDGSHFNRATQAKRQPGSAFKPIVYSAALDNGFTLTSQVLDAPIVFIDPWTNDVWRPSNFDPNFDGQMTLQTSLARSRNLSTVRVAQLMGMEAVLERAKALGLTGRMEPALAASLGAIEVTPMNMAQAYTAFANEGKVSTPRFITSIQGPWGNTIYEAHTEHVQAIPETTGYLMSAMLEAVVTRGTASRINSLGRPQGGKTGTTNEEVDAWFMGITPHLVTATYIGYDQPEPMGRGETGTRAALPIYKMYAEKAYEEYPPDPFEVPEGIVFYPYGGVNMPYAMGTSPDTSLNAMTGASTTPPKTEKAEDLLKQIF